MSRKFLLPGQLFVSNQTCEITTVLGSCVAVVLCDSKNKVIGMNHYLLASPFGAEVANCRYANFAIPQLYSEMLKAGADPRCLEAAIVGGGEVVANLAGREIGPKNIAVAEGKLKELGIPVRLRDVGGQAGRKVKATWADLNLEIEMQRPQSDQGQVDLTGIGIQKLKREVSVLIVDDSAVVRNLFAKIFTQFGLRVVGQATTAYEAREMLVKMKPDVMTLDIEMPLMNGVSFLEKVMQHMPIPTVMVSSLSSDGSAALKAMELGAVEFVQKPNQTDPLALKNLAEFLVAKVQAAANTDFQRLKSIQKGTTRRLSSELISVENEIGRSKVELLGVVGNTGAQSALSDLLRNLEGDTPPVLVANSTLAPMLDSYIASLKGKTKLTPTIAKDGQILHFGNVYFAPSGYHLRVTKNTVGAFVANLQVGAPVNSQQPSGSVLLRSLAEVAPKGSLGILLSGFGQDGADGAEMLSRKGGRIFAQEPGDCMFPHLVQAALAMGVVTRVSDIGQMAKEIWKCRNQLAA